MCVCSLSYLAWKVHAPHSTFIAICGLSSSIISSHIFSSTARLLWGKYLIEHKMSFFLFSLKILSEAFLILRIIQRDIIINVHISVFMCSTRYSFQNLIKLEFYQQIFENDSNIKFYKNPLVLKRNWGGDFVRPNYLLVGWGIFNMVHCRWYYYYCCCCIWMSPVTDLFFLVLLLNQR